MSQRYDFILNIARTLKPKRVMDIGVWDGVNSKAVIEASGCTEFWGFDLWEKCPDYEVPKQPPELEQVQALLEQTGVELHLVKGNTRETLKEKYPKMDLILIDGGHSVETIKSDWENVQKCMKKGTVVIFDDYYHNREDYGCKSIVDTIDKKKEFSEPVEFNNEIGQIIVSHAKVY